MPEELRCPRCGAHYTRKVPEWVTCVQCPYCNTAILVPRKDTGTSTKIIRVEEIVTNQPTKVFSLPEFSEFMRRKGYMLDPVSGLLKMGQIVITISEDGVAEGPEPHRTRIEKWISEYMKK